MANRYINMGDYTILEVYGLKHNAKFLVDNDDVELLKTRKWRVQVDSSISKSKRAVTSSRVHESKKKKPVFLSRMIMGVGINESETIVDHINRDTLDNRKINLRVVDRSTNNRNIRMSSLNTSGRTGVKYKKARGTQSDAWEGSYNIGVGEKGKELRRTRHFSIRKYGYEEAFKLASDFRKHGEEKYGILTERTFND